MVRINMKKRHQEPWLIPGCFLSERIRNLQHGATIVGSTFESITASMLKASRKTTDSSADLCPDAEVNGTLIESKAYGTNSRPGGFGQKSGRCMLEVGQLNKYRSIKASYSTRYYFWRYGCHKPVTGGLPFDSLKNGSSQWPRIGEVSQKVSTSILSCIVMDADFLHKVWENKDKLEGVAIRHCRLYFAGRRELDRDYLVLSDKFFDKVTQWPHNVTSILGLPQEALDITSQRRIVTFEMNGVKMKTNYFPLFTALDKIPF